jgi:shikimate kinase
MIFTQNGIMKIILVGYMGSGKSTVGKLLAQKLELTFLDLDAYIEQAECKSIAEVFQEKGEVFFRKREIYHLRAILENHDNYILATGGGAPCFGDNMQQMTLATPNMVYLKASINTLIERLEQEKEHRPLLKKLKDGELQEYIAKHLFERSFFYNQARIKVNVDDKSPQAIVEAIRALLV